MRKRKEPWKELGLTKSTYYHKLRNGRLPGIYTVSKTNHGRYSGLNYKNTKEKLLAIRDKYKNGIPEGIIEAMLGIESGG